MKQVDKMPTSGQFAVVYTYGGKVWSSVLLWGDGRLKDVDGSTGRSGLLIDIDYTIDLYTNGGAKYFIAD